MKARIDTAMVLAAGMGSRLRPLTDEMPKPLINIGGEPIIVRTLKALRRAGVVKVVMNTHHFCDHAGSHGAGQYSSRDDGDF